MAEEKKGFVLYADLIHTIKKMPEAQAGKLFLHILKYVNDENPEADDLTVELVFEQIKQQLKRDLEKWESKKKQWSDAGKKSAEARAAKKLKEDQRKSTTVQRRSTDSTVRVNDTVNVSVSVNDTVKAKVKENNKPSVPKAKKPPTLNHLMRLEFERFYEELKKDSYYFTAKDGMAIGQIKKKLAFSIKSKNGIDPTEAEILSTFEMFLGKIQDEWILNNLSISIINSKYNELISAIKEGRTPSGKKTITDDDIKAAFKRRYPNGIDQPSS